ncbi:hypothetical protein O181_046612 [Austropuccinia psidii MF-1]|uniref:Uncharacterized protein n=1 Tax=Austropuccinia psidii MF-1 TaxID=1389203 RepID=A0A9Q3DW79_9BASI|nr:hypothetical protein [Austropuccinia psidii MF-1]
MIPDLEKEGPVASTISKSYPELPKDNPKGPNKQQKGLRENKGKGKGKSNWHRAYPQGYRIPKLETSAMEIVLNAVRTLMDLTPRSKKG